MALLKTFCTRHKTWTHIDACLQCSLEALRDEVREEVQAEPVPQFQIPDAERERIYAALLAGDMVRLDEILAECDLDEYSIAVLRDACCQAHWALSSNGGDLPDSADTEWSDDYLASHRPLVNPNTFDDLWAIGPNIWAIGALAALAIYLVTYIFLRAFGCPPPPGMP